MFETECKESLGIINCTYIGIGVSVVLYHLIRHHPTKKNFPNKLRNKQNSRPQLAHQKNSDQPCNTAKQ